MHENINMIQSLLKYQGLVHSLQLDGKEKSQTHDHGLFMVLSCYQNIHAYMKWIKNTPCGESQTIHTINI